MCASAKAFVHRVSGRASWSKAKGGSTTRRCRWSRGQGERPAVLAAGERRHRRIGLRRPRVHPERTRGRAAAAGQEHV